MLVKKPAISVLDIFKIGVGPSSSHTVGPMRAARAFVLALRAQHGINLGHTSRIQVQLYGSLAATGIGHATDLAVAMGLMGCEPETIDPDSIASATAQIKRSAQLLLNGSLAIEFIWQRDIRFEPLNLPFHPNALRLTAFAGATPISRNTYYSVGGGFICDEASMAQADHDPQAPLHNMPTASPYPFSTAKQLLALCEQHQQPISAIMLANEAAWRTAAHTSTALDAIWQCMDACIQRGLRQTGVLPGGLGVQRRAHAMHRALMQGSPPTQHAMLRQLDWLNVYALAVNEENAAGGRVVTAPTNGAAGVVPAVLKYYLQHSPQAGQDEIQRYLLTAAAIGSLFKLNASISGAEVGCQGEVGSACAMAAAGLTEILGGTPQQVENAAEIGLEHNLGLTCDPVGGLVQIPCIERNAMAAVKAMNAAQLALLGNGAHMISLDQAIRTMRDTGRDMLDKYKETSLGGLAVSYIEC